MVYTCSDSITLSEVRNIILNTAAELDPLSGKISTGGMLDLGAAVTEAVGIEAGGIGDGGESDAAGEGEAGNGANGADPLAGADENAGTPDSGEKTDSDHGMGPGNRTDSDNGPGVQPDNGSEMSPELPSDTGSGVNPVNQLPRKGGFYNGFFPGYIEDIEFGNVNSGYGFDWFLIIGPDDNMLRRPQFGFVNGPIEFNSGMLYGWSDFWNSLFNGFYTI